VKEGEVEEEQLYDIWDTQTPTAPSVHEPLSAKSFVKSKRSAKPSTLPALSVPHAGISYNPDHSAHNELIQQAVDEQLAKRKELNKVRKKLKHEKLPKDFTDIVVDGETDEQEDNESEGEGEEGKEERKQQKTGAEIVEDDEDNSTQAPHVNQPHIPRTTKVERRALEKRLKKHRKLNRKNRKERKKQVNVDKDLTEVDQEENAREKELKERQRKREMRPVRASRLGPELFQEPEITVALSEDIPDSLRQLKPNSGSLLVERFKSFQQRGILEPRSIKNYHRRYALKVKEKRLAREYSERQAKKYANVDGTEKNV